MTRLSEIIIIAGPNGAGKTTFAENYLTAQLRNYSFINADQIAKSLLTRIMHDGHRRAA